MLRLFADRDALLASLVADWANDCLQVPCDDPEKTRKSSLKSRRSEWLSHRSKSIP